MDLLDDHDLGLRLRGGGHRALAPWTVRQEDREAPEGQETLASSQLGFAWYLFF